MSFIKYTALCRAIVLLGVVLVITIAATMLVWAQTSGELSENREFDVSQSYGPGDVKEGYEDTSYTTQSRSLLERRGRSLDLIRYAEELLPLGLPPVPIPADNPLSREKIELGRRLFFDRRLSINDTLSCAGCHIPEQGFTNNELPTPVGVEGRSVLRNAPTLYNVAYLRHLFWDGREFSLENQVWQPITAHSEMAAPSIGYVINKIQRIRDYDGLFEEAFDGRGADIQTVGQAIASYQRTLLAADSPFDRWRYGSQKDAISDAAKRGFAVFAGKGRCIVCHPVQSDYALFTDQQFHNTGLGYRVSFSLQNTQPDDKVRVQLAPGVFTYVTQDVIQSITRRKPPNDLGLYRITGNPNDRWKFRTQTLRNIALTAPYMHNGAFQTLREVIDFYDRGGIPNELLSPLIGILNLTEQEKLDLEAFLNSLTGSNVPDLVSDAFAAPIGDLGPDDPNWAHDNSLGY